MVSYEDLPAKLRERAGDVAEGLIENVEATAEMLLEAWHCRRLRVRLGRVRESLRSAVRRSSLIEDERRATMLHVWASIEDAIEVEATADDVPTSPTGRMLRILAELERYRLHSRRGDRPLSRPAFGPDVEEAAGDVLDALAQGGTDRLMQSINATRVSGALRPVLGTSATLVNHDVYPYEGSPR